MLWERIFSSQATPSECWWHKKVIVRYVPEQEGLVWGYDTKTQCRIKESDQNETEHKSSTQQALLKTDLKDLSEKQVGAHDKMWILQEGLAFSYANWLFSPAALAFYNLLWPQFCQLNSSSLMVKQSNTGFINNYMTWLFSKPMSHTREELNFQCSELAAAPVQWCSPAMPPLQLKHWVQWNCVQKNLEFCKSSFADMEQA